jgi:hypothetical protein
VDKRGISNGIQTVPESRDMALNSQQQSIVIVVPSSRQCRVHALKMAWH